jgi:uncharacterized protein YkwD
MWGLLLVLLSLATNGSAQNNPEQEAELYRLIMEYRKANGLPEIPRSTALTQVARMHVRDLVENHPDKGDCNLHSWSAHGNWSACCYTADHSQASCMWNKPREMTGYKGNGFEIAHWNSAVVTPEGALRGWQGSHGHNAVILNQDNWSQKWNAIGIAIRGNYAVAWFGMQEDPDQTGH